MSKIALSADYSGAFVQGRNWLEIAADRERHWEQGLLPRFLKAPLMGLWEITGRCNLRCAYCYNESPRAPDDLEWPIVERLAHEICEMKVLMFCVSGGEPTLHPHYIDILKILAEGCVSLGTVTNGWTMSPELARSMAPYAATVQVSLDGPTPEVHDRVRGRQGSFERVVRAIRLLRDAGVREILASFAATRLNIDSFPATAELCAELGVNSLRTQPLAMVGRAEGDTILEPTPDQTRHWDEFLAKSGGKVGDLTLEWGDPSVHLKVGAALGMSMLVRITNDGNFGLTPWYPIFFGNARESSLAEVWESGLRLGWHHEAVRPLFEDIPDSPVLRTLPGLEKPLHIGCARSGVAIT